MTTVIQNLPTPPTPGNPYTEFNSKAFALLGALPQFVDEANQLGSELTQAAAGAESDAEAARLSKEAAAGSAQAAGTHAGNASTDAGRAAGSAGGANAAKEAAELARNAARDYAESIDPANLLKRANHTGMQAIETVSNLGIALPALVKADPTKPCIIKTGATTLAIKAGTHAKIGNGYVSFPVQTAVTMPALTGGEDYSVWVKPDGSVVALADPYFSPAAAPVPGALKIGGSHYGLTAPGTTPASGGFATTGTGMIWTQSGVDKISGFNEFSIWDLQYRPSCDPRGMYLALPDVFADIYLLNEQHIANGTSRYNAAIASGTVPPVKPLVFGGNGSAKYGGLSWFEASEVMHSHGKRLPSYGDFSAAAFGVTESQSIGGAASTPPATLRQPGYTTAGGGEQFTGHLWVWGAVAHGVVGTDWVPASAGRGQTYGTPYAPMFGGDRASLTYSGSRASNWSFPAWNSAWVAGARGFCDRIKFGGY